MNIKKISLAIIIYSLFFTTAKASVVMQGNRVIFDAAARSQSIKFTNNDSFPYMVQTWTSLTSDEQYQDKNTAPFIVSPVVFKIQPHADQMVNLIYTDSGNRIDREKIYYLHFTQVPSIPASTTKENKLVLMVNSTVKIFLRPKNLSPSYEDMLQFISYSVQKNGSQCNINIKNESPYFLNAVSLSIKNHQGNTEKNISMINPYASINVNNTCSGISDASSLSLKYINDYGVFQTVVLNKK